MQILNPEGWPRPRGYSNGIAAEGRQVFVAGQVGSTPEGDFAPDFGSQFRRVLENTVAVLAEAGAKPEHITRMTWYVIDLDKYLAALREVGAAYGEIIGKHYPTMTLVEVSRLVYEDALLEIESTAVVPSD
ncbi:MAG: RidA family protein [Alphaproteobacteria bacterium]|nr:RidA family protein [Alphaproteobacteria bacterium]MCY4497579.1 RidA family protein [Rhodospirillaceae bacterium]